VWGGRGHAITWIAYPADLVLAEQLVEQEQRLVHSQRGFIARLEAQHHNTKAAETLLRSMLKGLATEFLVKQMSNKAAAMIAGEER